MVAEIKSWFSQNSSLVIFLGAQIVALGGLAAAMIAYSVKLETRVSTMETRGAEYTVDRMQKMFDRLTVLEKHYEEHQTRLNRITEQILRDMQYQRQPPR